MDHLSRSLSAIGVMTQQQCSVTHADLGTAAFRRVGLFQETFLGTSITNADQGVLYSWADCPHTYNSSAPCAAQFHLTTVTNGSASTVTTNIGYGGTSYFGTGYAVPVQPVLQRADRWSLGTLATSAGSSMIAFAGSGQQLWTQPNYTPQIATSGGGVIATSTSSQTVTFDNNGNQTGQLTSLSTQSFIGNNYQLGSTDQVAAMPYDYTTSYAGTSGGSPGAYGTYIPTLGAIYRSQIASDAKSYVGSTQWNEKKYGGVTCNLFVRDILTQASNECQASIPAPVKSNLSWWQSNWSHPFLAADWANPTMDGGCWKPLPEGPNGALPGDIIATGWPPNGPDATGHVGIVVEPDGGYPNYIDSSAADVAPYWWTSQQKQSFVAGTITLTDYGFRQSGF